MASIDIFDGCVVTGTIRGGESTSRVDGPSLVEAGNGSKGGDLGRLDSKTIPGLSTREWWCISGQSREKYGSHESNEVRVPLYKCVDMAIAYLYI